MWPLSLDWTGHGMCPQPIDYPTPMQQSLKDYHNNGAMLHVTMEWTDGDDDSYQTALEPKVRFTFKIRGSSGG